MVARYGGTVQVSIDVRLEHPAYVLYNPHTVFYALGTNLYTVRGLSRCVMAKYELTTSALSLLYPSTWQRFWSRSRMSKRRVELVNCFITGTHAVCNKLCRRPSRQWAGYVFATRSRVAATCLVLPRRPGPAIVQARACPTVGHFY
eukprot:g36564.t1